MKISEFVHQSLNEIAPAIEQYGFDNITTDHIINATNISRSRLLSHFGGLHGLLELVMLDQIAKCFNYIYEKTIPSKNIDEALIQFHRYRSEYIESSSLLQIYHKEKYKQSKRIIQLKAEIDQIEIHEKNRFIHNYKNLKKSK
ncbi:MULTISPECIES: TetR/AcrR family transcriptional regulator [Sphingobacterium]|uniref:TetR/AcrR family transcriptional regulator n=1 Tax=Sphingobacterium TaxID=28453 RepID=UPI00104B7035|nr:MULTISPECIES: TetR/AcrR family transcriptional regulator [Sphingobacterium]MCW2263059.1 AcrR family transcriptional regulator [Sphingobacterium kitahiroshimense]TCR11951.1 hypothetical protein EDF67_103365 [Sphingobacterium sp. JUb78]